MYFFKHLLLFLTLILLCACTQEQESSREKQIVPKKITMLFVTQPSCPSCDQLEETMNLQRPKELIQSYFNVKKVYLGVPLPSGLIEPKGTPTIYFIGADNEVLLDPMVGEKNEKQLIPYLENALDKFKNTYGIDLTLKHKKIKNRDKNETYTTLQPDTNTTIHLSL